MQVPQRRGDPVTVSRDEGVRPDSTPETLARLRTIMPGGTVTAGNASQQNDAAAACLVVAEDRLGPLGLEPLGFLVGWAAAGCDPATMGIGPVPAVEKLFDRTGLGFDRHRSGRAQRGVRRPGARRCWPGWGWDEPDKLNVNGSGISLGHPIGATGARILATGLRELQRRERPVPAGDHVRRRRPGHGRGLRGRVMSTSVMSTAVIVDGVRTPAGRGKAGGALAGVHPVDLLAGALDALVRRTGIDPALVEDVITGCAQQVGEQSGNIARHALLAAGWPEAVPATTIDRQCGSSQQAATFAAQGVMSGGYDIVIAAGSRSMSAVPHGQLPAGQGHRPAEDRGPLPGWPGAPGHLRRARSPQRWKLGPEGLDAYSAPSRTAGRRRPPPRAAFGAEIVPVPSPTTAPAPVTADETIRPRHHRGRAGRAAALVPHRGDGGQRSPEIGWQITPGNSSPLTDGASAVLIMSEDAASRLGLRPRARFHAFSVIGDDPLLMLTGPIPATRKILDRSGLTIDDIDAYEVNEAFAPVPLAWAAEFGADPGRLNPRGGAIALGHALGASGTRLLVTLLNHLEQTGGRYGLQTMCEGGGMANATIIERL